MRFPVLAMFALVGCSSSEATTTVTSSSGRPQSSASASAAKSAAAPAPASAASPAASASAAPASALGDAETELKSIDPFTDKSSQEAVRSAMNLCGLPPHGDRWGDLPDAKSVVTAPCSAASHAKVYMKAAAMTADGKVVDKTMTAEGFAAIALALDPKAALPEGASAAAKKALEAAKKQRASGVRLGAVSTSDEATKKDLETAIAGELMTAVRFCYAWGRTSNDKMEGKIAIEADVAADGRLTNAKLTDALPAAEEVTACIVNLANRSKVSAPSKAPAKVNIPFVLAPGES